jgi:hypothetical protein
MRFQYASDLHLEFYRGKQNLDFSIFLEPVAPVLILAGDIGYPYQTITREFLQWCSKRWETILWVFGNHEYFNYSISTKWKYGKTVRTIQESESDGKKLEDTIHNLYILQGQSMELSAHPGTLFFGATLWSPISPELHATEGARMADFKLIAGGRDKDKDPFPMTLEQRTDLYQRHLAALEAAIQTAESEGKDCVIITHHLPTYGMIPDKYKGSSTNAYYANRLDHLLVKPCVKAWICGHSHGRKILEFPTYCGLNARGYPGEQTPENPYQRVAVVDTKKIRAVYKKEEEEQTEFL